MVDNGPDAQRLAELEERLQKARRRGGETPQAKRSDSSLGVALRLSFDIIAAVVVGAGMGWLLDRWFGTAPFLFIVFFFLGAAAGFLNVIRAARKMDEKEAERLRKN
jgi:ATP synthase protein I